MTIKLHGATEAKTQARTSQNEIHAPVSGGAGSGGVKECLIKAPLTETQGLELVLGVGERCTVTSAIQWPGSGHHLRASKGGETSIIVLRKRKPSRTWVVCLCSFFFPSVPPASLFRSDG